MKLDFIKMHGCGNDYVYVDAFKNKISNPNKLSEIVSDRHFSIGGDGMIMVCPSDCADAKMRMFNADGSEGKMCGNGVRCVAKFVYDNGISKKNRNPLGHKRNSVVYRKRLCCRRIRQYGKSRIHSLSYPCQVRQR